MLGNDSSKAQRFCKHAFIFIIVLWMTLAVLPLGVRAEQTMYVDCTNTAGPWDGSQAYPYKTIATAVAQSQATIIYVSAGTYSENVVITHSLQLIGASSLSTTIDGGGHGHTVAVTGAEAAAITVSISGFTIQNAGQHGFANLACSYATGSTIQSNTLQSSQEGDNIQLDHCTGLTIHSNIITNAYVSGISLTLCSSCLLDANTIRYSQKGLSFSYSSSNTITGNTVTHNTVYGVYLYQSSQNQFAHNEFTVNGQHATDPCTNAWSTGQQGNTWDDYQGYDNDSNGIGDIPYSIPGGANRDDYPLGVFKTTQPPGETNSPPTVVSIIVTPAEAFVGDLVSFSGEGQDSDGIIQGYSWHSTRDGQLSTAKAFTSTSLSVGVHTISLSVQDNDGAWSSTRTTTLTIKASPQPVIDSITPATVYAGQTVTFHGHAENADDLAIEYQWSSSSDGVLSSASVFSRSNLSIGVHAISLRIKAAGRDWSSPVTQLLTVEQPDPQAEPPVADAGGPYQGYIGEPILVDASKSSSPSGADLTFTWGFGDGTNGTGKSAEHTYTAPGSYNLTLTVTNPQGSASSTALVAIADASSQTETGQHPGSSAGSILSALPVPVFLVIGMLVFFGVICVVLLGLRRP